MYKNVKSNPSNDKVLWEGLVTITTIHNEYSSHIVKLYENTKGNRYYIFFQPFIEDRFENCDWDLLDCWGTVIMNYTVRDYEELRKQIYFDDKVSIYQVLCTYKEFVENKYEKPRIISPKYRY